MQQSNTGETVQKQIYQTKMKEIIEYFNNCPAKSLATVDTNGNPNICLCGSAIMVDEKTIHALYGYFEKSYTNIKQNHHAVFLATKGFSESYWKHFESTGEKLYIPGYRFYCRFKEETTDPAQLSPIKKRLSQKIGNRIVSKLKLLLIFEIKEIREIVF